jgi:hypothetical protein
VAAQPLNPLNGQSAVFYFELEQTDKTDRAFYNAFVGELLREEPGNVTAKVAANETRRLLKKYQYEFIIIDEFQFLQDSTTARFPYGIMIRMKFSSNRILKY